jgi:integrase
VAINRRTQEEIGTMIIRPHLTHPGWYQLDGYIGGKRERVTCKSYAEAERLKASVDEPERQRTTHPQIETVIADYLEWVKNNQAPDTYITKERRFRRWIIPFFGKYRVKDLSQTLLDTYRKQVTASLLAMDVTHIMALISWMVKRGYAERLTWQPEAPLTTRKIKIIPEPVNISIFLAAIPIEMHRVASKLMLYAGLRFAEVKRLKWENYRGDVILCADTKTGEPFQQPIPDPLKEWFEANKQTKGPVFSHNGTTPICNLALSFDKARKATGVYMTPHLLRHASATFLYEQTNDIYAVQQHLRHSKPSTSQIYTRYSAARRKAAQQTVYDYMEKG